MGANCVILDEVTDMTHVVEVFYNVIKGCNELPLNLSCMVEGGMNKFPEPIHVTELYCF